MHQTDVINWIELHQLVNRYPHALDSRDAELFTTLWHPDALWAFSGDMGSHRGVDAMLEFVQHSWTTRHAHHLVTNVVIDLRDDGTAHGRSVAYAQVSTPEGATRFPMIVTYRDEYVQHEQRWVFMERHVTTDFRGAEAVDQLRALTALSPTTHDQQDQLR